ncbi:MAG: PadR family transcriptional regulator [Anaerolineales bacterium]
MEFLTRIEEILLLTVHRLDPEAYGVTIRAAVEELLGKSVSVGAVYVPLDRLTERGYLETSYSDPTPERGGRRKKYFKLTQNGLKILGETKSLNDALWENVPSLDPA